MVRQRQAAAFALVLGLALSGCLGIKEPEPVVVDGSQSYLGRDLIVESGRLEVPANAELRLENGTLRLSKQEGLVQDGLLDVRGTLVLRNANLESLFRLTAHPGSTLVLDGVTIPATATAPLIRIQTPDATITGSDLRVRGIEIAGSAVVRGNMIQGMTQFPAVTWTVGSATFEDNEVSAVGGGVLFQNTAGVARNNQIFAGQSDLAIGMDIRGGTIRIEDNRVEGGNASMSLLSFRGSVSRNEFQSPGTVGIFYQDSNATVSQNNITGGVVGIEMTQNPRGRFSNITLRDQQLGVRATEGRFSFTDLDVVGVPIAMNVNQGAAALKDVYIENASVAALVADSSALEIEGLTLTDAGAGMTWSRSTGSLVDVAVFGGRSFLTLTESQAEVESATLTGTWSGLSLHAGSSANVSGFRSTLFNITGIAASDSQLLMGGTNVLSQGAGIGIALHNVLDGSRIEGTTVAGVVNQGAVAVEDLGAGLAVTGSSAPTVTGNSFMGNQVGVFAQLSSRPLINGNCIEGNTNWGVGTDSGPGVSAQIDATGNWWGNVAGATPPLEQGPGAGDKAGYGVDFSGHLTTSNCASL